MFYSYWIIWLSMANWPSPRWLRAQWLTRVIALTLALLVACTSQNTNTSPSTNTINCQSAARTQQSRPLVKACVRLSKLFWKRFIRALDGTVSIPCKLCFGNTLIFLGQIPIWGNYQGLLVSKVLYKSIGVQRSNILSQIENKIKHKKNSHLVIF